MTVDANGRPADLEAALSGLFSAAGGGGGGAQGPMMNQMCVLPDQPVSVGDSWGMTVTFPNVPDALMTMTNTLESVDASGAEQTARIRTATSLSIPTPVLLAISQPGMPMPEVTIERMSMSGEGESLHSVTTGRRGNGSQQFEMEMATAMPMPAMPQQAGQPAMPSNVTMSVTMSGTMQSTVTY